MPDELKPCDICNEESENLKPLFNENVGYCGEACEKCHDIYGDFFVVLRKSSPSLESEG